MDQGETLSSEVSDKVNEVEGLVSSNAARMSELAGVLVEQTEATNELSENVSTVASHAQIAATLSGLSVNGQSLTILCGKRTFQKCWSA